MTKKKCGKIAIIGQPNVGKSTLLNFILGQKLSITSRKAQTTRNQILGIHSEKDIQFIFVDTPGYQQKFLNQMNKRMNKSVTSVFHDVDVVIFMSEPKTLNEIEIELVKMIPNDTPVINLINKIDRIKNKNKILELIDINSELQIFKKIIDDIRSISAHCGNHHHQKKIKNKKKPTRSKGPLNLRELFRNTKFLTSFAKTNGFYYY